MRYTRKTVYRRLSEDITIPKEILILCIGITLSITIVSLIQPYLYKTWIDDVMTDGNILLLDNIILAMIGAYLLKLVLVVANTYITKKFSYKITLEVKSKLMNRFFARDLSTLVSADVGAQNNNIEQDATAVSRFLISHTVNTLASFVTSIAYIFLLLKINVHLGILSMILLPVTVWISRRIGGKYNEVNKEIYKVNAKTHTYLFDTIQKWKEIKTNTLEELFCRKYDEMLEPERELNKKWMFYYALRNLFHGLKDELIIKVLIYFVGGLLIIKNDISIGELLMFVSYMAGMEVSVDTVMKSRTDFVGDQAIFDRLFSILDTPDKIKGQKFPQDATIYLQDIKFAYGDKKSKVLENACCVFEKGKRYLLVGKSGAGKSTLVKLILRDVQLQDGQILFGSVPTELIDTESLLKNIGVIMQENIFFNLSIRENFELVMPEATEEDINYALKCSELYDFVQTLPKKIDTVIGERGIKLSGGQKQRLAIARMILYKPQILILDESTNALDSETERKVLANLTKIFRNKTMIIISHRPLTCLGIDETYSITDRHIMRVTND